MAPGEDRGKSKLVRESPPLDIEERRWRHLQRETAARAQALNLRSKMGGMRSKTDVAHLVTAGRRE
jgi:hypothetical protein